MGAGVAGITLAKALQARGIQTLLMESGGLKMEPATQALYQLEEIGHPLRRDYHSRARFFGGSCNLWAGRNMLLGREDFTERSWLPDSAWPIGPLELEPWYPEACRILGLPGVETFSHSTASRHFSPTEHRLLSHPDLASTVSLWGKSPARPGRDALPGFQRSTSVTVLLNASALAIRRQQGSGHAELVEASTLEGRRLEVRASCIVLACGGLENARLMLLSTDWSDSGIGNASGLLGRCFMDHPRTVFGKFTPDPQATLRALLGRALPGGRMQLGLRLSPTAQAKHRLPNHYVTFEPESSQYASVQYQALAQAAKLASGTATGTEGGRLPELIYLLSPKELIPHSAYRLLQAIRDRAPTFGGQRSFVVVYFCEQPPLATSRVSLGKTRDALGLPRLQLDWDLDPAFFESILRTQTLLSRALTETGAGKLEPGVDAPKFTDASHHMGTTRMASSHGAGVVDLDCRVYGVPNLFVAGSSVFPSGGHANPTLTIVSLALRLAHQLAGELTKSLNLN